jgi:hypothetical protein
VNRLKFRVSNKLFDILTPEELYVYGYLRSNEIIYKRKTVTNIDILAAELSILKRKEYNRQRIKEILTQLHVKGLINVNMDGVKNDIPLHIQFLNIDDWKTNYTFLYDWFLSVNNYDEFFALSYIEQWANKNDKQITILEFAGKGGWSISKTKDILKRLKDKEVITVISGEYYNDDIGQIRQEANKYKINHQDIEEVKVKEKSKPIEPEQEEHKSSGDQEVFKYYMREYKVQDLINQWAEVKKLEEHHYVFMKVYQHDPRLKQAVLRYERTKENGKFDFSKWEDAYKRYVKKQQEDEFNSKARAMAEQYGLAVIINGEMKPYSPDVNIDEVNYFVYIYPDEEKSLKVDDIKTYKPGVVERVIRSRYNKEAI